MNSARKTNLTLIIVAEKNITVIFIWKHTRFDNQIKEVVIPSNFNILNGTPAAGTTDKLTQYYNLYSYLSTHAMLTQYRLLSSAANINNNNISYNIFFITNGCCSWWTFAVSVWLQRYKQYIIIINIIRVRI